MNTTVTNMGDKSLINLLIQLCKYLSPRRKMQFSLLAVLMIFTSFAEIFSLGAVFPFLGVLSSPEMIYRYPYVRSIVSAVGIDSAKDMLLPLTLLFGVGAIMSASMRIMQVKANTRISFAAGADLSILLYRKTLYQPYSLHVTRNSSQIIDGVATKVHAVIYQIIMPFFLFCSAIVNIVAIGVTLIAINPSITLSGFIGFGLTYGIIISITRTRLKNNSESIAHESRQMVKSLQEGLGGIRDVLLDGTQELYGKMFSKAVIPLRRAQGDNQFMNQSPRFGIEAIGMILIGGLAYILSLKPGGVVQAIPVLGTLALGAQRLLPVLQQCYSSWSSMQGGIASFQEILLLLEQAIPVTHITSSLDKLLFKDNITLKSISFRYSAKSPDILCDVNLVITKGSRVGIIGATGSGKSTLIDIIMGLLQPSKGCMVVDNNVITIENQRAWQSCIAHVPQSIYLSDETIEENIAFGVPKENINHDRVLEAAKLAHISDVIELLPKKYNTVVGERGVRLSGGQRQRIGLARALYRKADVIILDEATSALDNHTEDAVMTSIAGLKDNLTVIIIAHRLSTLRFCDVIVNIEHGEIRRIGSYDDIVGYS